MLGAPARPAPIKAGESAAERCDRLGVSYESLVDQGFAGIEYHRQLGTSMRTDTEHSEYSVSAYGAIDPARLCELMIERRIQDERQTYVNRYGINEGVVVAKIGVVHLPTDARARRREQQIQLAAYMIEKGGEVVGFGDTRLGDDPVVMGGLTRRAIIANDNDRNRGRTDEEGEGGAMSSSSQGTRTQVRWSSAGSVCERNDSRRGGVAMAS
jgi:hypothetical protein